MERLTAPLTALHPNPWNPNKMNERQYAAATESITTFGFIDPITVRPHPDIQDGYQVVDGEHRWKAAQELGLTEVPIVLINVTDAQAKKLTIILNETRGTADTIDLASLLEELSQELTPDELLNALPYSQAELDELLDMGAFDWDAYTQEQEDQTEGEQDNEFHTITARIPADAYSVLQQARAIIEQHAKLNTNPAVAWGQVMELLAAEYVAGNR